MTSSAVTDPDEPLTVVYDGPARDAHHYLIPGLYTGTSYEEEERGWVLHVTEQHTIVQPADRKPSAACETSSSSE